MKRFLILLLSAVSAFVSVGCACVRMEEAAPAELPYHTDLTFSELSASGVDASLELARTKELLFRIENGELSGERALNALQARTDAYEKLQTDASIAYVRYCLDVTNEANQRAYDTLTAKLNAIGCDLAEASLRLIADPALKDRFDASEIAAIKRANALTSPEILPLAERERALVGRYETLGESLSVAYKGRAWTGDEILSDPTLSEEDFSALYEAYLSLFNAEAGAIFLELIEVRRAIAKTLGFDSYADYAYACFGRDYTPGDAARLCERVKEKIVPKYRQMRGNFYAGASQLSGTVFLRDPTMEKIRSAVAAALPELAKPWDYMIAHEMYDLGTDSERMPGSFTIRFKSFGTPFLFSTWSNGFDMPPAVIHEFGHFSSYYFNDGARDGGSLDLAEFDAQGLELLTVLRYDTIYGDLCDAASDVQLWYAYYALIDGCLEDAFQQFAYSEDGITLERLNEAYGRLCAEYGLDLIGIEARSWTQIPHTFQSPYYYISYATSMVAALELYALAQTDAQAAQRTYRAVLHRENGAGFRETLRAAGLSDPFAEDGA